MESRVILVVDDDEHTRRLIEVALTKAEFNVITAKNGTEALEFFKKHVPDGIVLDIVMPDMDGYSLIREIKNMPEIKDVPLIVSSGKSGMQEYFELEEELYRPDAFLSKPYRMDNLIETAKRVFHK